MPKLDPQIAAHLEWIGFVRPTGLVVSAPALARAGAILPRDPEGQRLLRACVAERRFDPHGEPEPYLPDFREFAGEVLGWSFSPKGYAGTDDCPIPPELETPLHAGGELLRPDFAVRERDPRENAPPWQLLVCMIERGQDFDRASGGAGRLEVSAHGRMERLLRQTGVPAGLLFNGRSMRLVSAPRGESSGWLDLHVADMVKTAGRPMVAALRLLLSQKRLLTMRRDERFAALLQDSRRFQNEVSERLAEQVLHALYELLRGVQAADDASKGALLRGPLAERPDDIYHALLTVILRLVFLLYAEERDLLPDGETFARHYSLAGLYERLREDAALHPDTMNQRYGAWAQLLVLFRLFHDGADADGLRLPRRHGALFDPDRFPFLEGRGSAGARQIHERIEPPLVPDGTLYRALDKLLVLDGERISYRALDVEQIGSVYETMMGFRLETATGRSVAIKAQKKHGAPTAVDLEALAAEPGGRRAQWLRERTDRALTDTVRKPVAQAATVADLHAALQPVIDTAATPDLVPPGALVLQPSEARRRSGSHYTPRELTEPIVRTTLEPILARLRGPGGEPPPPEAILDLKVCDPAMGSGAFLVEACRQLGDALIEAWRAHKAAPELPAGEDEVIAARRLIAQRCLYGVDRNPMAVDLAKVSLWLATLAKEHALTFVDHALRHGDSLVGLSQRQIEAFHWDTSSKYSQQGFETIPVREQVAKVKELRRRIREADASVTDWELRDWWNEARFELNKVRLFGDLATAAFFEGAKPKEREAKRAEYARAVYRGQGRSVPRRARRAPPRRPAPRPLPLGARVPGGVRAEAISREREGEPLAGEGSGIRCDRRESAVCRQELGDGGQRRELSRLVEGDPRGKPRQRRPRGPLFPPRVRSRARAGRLRPHRNQHHRPGRHARQRPALDLQARRRDIFRPPPGQMARSGRRRRQRAAHRQGSGCRTEADRRPQRRPRHRVPVPPWRPRRSRAAQGQRGQELPGQHRPRHGLHVRRHRHEGRRVAAVRDAPAHREGPAEPGGDLSVHRRAGGEQQPDARASPVRDQLPRLSVEAREYRCGRSSSSETLYRARRQPHPASVLVGACHGRTASRVAAAGARAARLSWTCGGGLARRADNC